MDFPAYVPAAVQAHIAWLVEGDDKDLRTGFAASLARAKEELAHIKSEIAAQTNRVAGADLARLRQKQVEQEIHRDHLAADVDCLRRLAHDRRMREVYSALTAHFTEDEQWRGFINSAWSARMNYAPYRQRLKRATELKSDIAKTAEKLARLLLEIEDVSPNCLLEFADIATLLERSETGGFHLAEQGRNNPGYDWESAPSLPKLLVTLAQAAHNYWPREPGMIGAAMSSRKQNPKTEYLRALVSLLRDDRGVSLTTPIMHAMSAISNVVINDPNVDVSYDDVKKARARVMPRLRRSSARCMAAV